MIVGSRARSTGGAPWRSFGVALAVVALGVFVAPVGAATPEQGFVTYLGGRANDGVTGIAVDDHGAAYVAGFTDTTDFPAHPGLSNATSQGPGVFVSKFSPDGRSLAYSTFIGDDAGGATGIAVDGTGAAYVTGTAYSRAFPTTGSHECGASDPDGRVDDVFVAKLSPDGSRLEYSTCLGGSGADFGSGIAVDSSGAAYVTGETRSSNFPTKNAAQTDPRVTDESGDAFVAKLDPDGDLAYSTYLGGSRIDRAAGIAVDPTGAAYVTGDTDSADFPVRNAFQAGRAGAQDAFVTKLAPNGASIAYSTYLGGGNSDRGMAIAVDANGAAYLTGDTTSGHFPVKNAVQRTWIHGDDAFVTKLNANGQSLAYSTYLGGSSQGHGIAVDARGDALVTGQARSSNFPVDVPVHTAGQAHHAVAADAFATRVAQDGRSVTYSAFLGGSRDDHGRAIAVDDAGNAYLGGETASKDLRTHNAVQPHYAGDRLPLPSDGFVARLRLAPAPSVSAISAMTCSGKRATLVGTTGADVIHSTSAADVIVARSGADHVSGKAGADVICLGRGDDKAWGNQDHDVILGSIGSDSLYGGSGPDVLSGGRGNDHLFGGPGHDLLTGFKGNDQLWGGQSVDRCRGGSGHNARHSC